jgi:hypothetical protein
MRWLLALFLVAHGLVHVAIWLTPASSDAPFDVRRSPLFGDLGAVATAWGLFAGGGFVVSGIAYLLDAAWWPAALVVASGVSFVLLLATFTTWWLLALAIDVVLGVVALRAAGGSP